MLNLLPQTLNSFSKNSKATVNSLIREMKTDKTELMTAISKLSSFTSGSDFVAAKLSSFSLLEREVIIEMFRDSYLRIQSFFTAMNSAGLAINSMVSIFSSEIEKVEKDIDNLELFINNYEFISGKDDLYNHNYIEKFTDFLSDYRYDGSNFLIPDRDNSTFPLGGNGFIDTTRGVFKFGSSTKVINVLNRISSISVDNNYANYISTNSDPYALFNETLLDSWNVTIKSPTILTSSLSEYSSHLPYDASAYTGAQTVVDIKFTEAIMMDTVRFTPNSGNDFQVMQVCLFTDFSNNGFNVLSEPVSIRGLNDVVFPKRMVNRIIFIFNQSSYTRGKMVPITSELNSKALDVFVQERISERRKKFSKYQDMVYWYFKRRIARNTPKHKSEFDFYSYKFPAEQDLFNKLISEEIFANANFGLDYKYSLNRSSTFLNLIQNVFKSLAKNSDLIDSSIYVEGYTSVNQKFIDHAGFLIGGNSSNVYQIKDQFNNYSVAGGTMADAIQAMLVTESKDVYEYLFSLRSIDFLETSSTEVDKACYVSKKIPVNGQISALKAKLDALPVDLGSSFSDYDLKTLVSYELSISSEENPVSELNWYPISFNNIRTIESEVVFFDTSDYSATLRFVPVADSIFLYKDGKRTSSFRYNPIENKIYITDPNIYSSSNIFCVSYDLDLIRYGPDELDFVKANLLTDSVRTYGNANGSGQNFQKTDFNRTINLDYTPYVNQAFIPGSTYSFTNGTIFSNNSTGYSPVKVLLNDGSYAVNITNYTGKPEGASFYASNQVLFLQNGKQLVFSAGITSPFTVYYDYIPNNLRFRFIARKNIPNLDVPIRIDNLLLKMKTLNFDPYYDKLSLGTLGR